MPIGKSHPQAGIDPNRSRSRSDGDAARREPPPDRAFGDAERHSADESQPWCDENLIPSEPVGLPEAGCALSKTYPVHILGLSGLYPKPIRAISSQLTDSGSWCASMPVGTAMPTQSDCHDVAGCAWRRSGCGLEAVRVCSGCGVGVRCPGGFACSP